MPKQFNFSFINLGCTKNLVDSQHFLGRLFDISLKTPDYQLRYFTDPFQKETDIVFVNTCGFISTGRDEAEELVCKLLKAKKNVYLLGCAVQYFTKLKNGKVETWKHGILQKRINNSQLGTKRTSTVSKSSLNSQLFFLSRGDLNKVTIKNLMQGYDSKTFGNFEFSKGPRVYTNLQDKFEYLKIAEGCNNHCSFCIIPQIRGKQQSLPIEKIIAEVKNMLKAGIQEIILIAQDTTRYGSDLYGKPALFELLRKIDEVGGDFRYRLLYLYPDVVTLKQLEQLTKLKKFIPYFDVPLQHISSPILKRMGRFYDEKYIKKFLGQIKKLFPVHFIRTNLIIGFPGETKQDFEKLKTFVQEENFDTIALFEYHDEPLAASSRLGDKVGDLEIRRRFKEMESIVDKLLMKKQKARKGKQEIGFIINIETLKNGNLAYRQAGVEIGKDKNSKLGTIHYTLTVRPRLHCPEIDSYDEISAKQIVGTFEKKNELEIGDKIMYTI